MHETIISKDIIETAKKQGKVKEIFLEAGELAHISPDELLETLKQLVKWKIHLKKIKPKITCKCGFSGEPKILAREHDFILYECPKCEETPPLEEGDKIILKEVIVE